MRAVDPVGINTNATGRHSHGQPERVHLLDLSRLMPTAGSYVNPHDGHVGLRSVSVRHDEARRVPRAGFWNVDFGFSKRFRFGSKYAAQIRIEMYNLFNHANMYVIAANADVSSTDMITGYKDGNRRIQLGFKFEF